MQRNKILLPALLMLSILLIAGCSSLITEPEQETESPLTPESETSQADPIIDNSLAFEEENTKETENAPNTEAKEATESVKTESGNESIQDESSESAKPESSSESVQKVSITAEPVVTKVAAAAQYIEGSNGSNLIGKEPVALFFHAQWCYICRDLEAAVKADLANFPAGAKIVEVNYDTEIELKKKYGIVIQSTIVVLDTKGNVVKTLSAPSSEQLKAAIESSLS